MDALLKIIGGVVIASGILLYVHFRREHEEETGQVQGYEKIKE